jgi:eukaryotic-like serine/threonine-protein kinase
MQFDRLGPYKIGPRLGRGGMGAVFEGVNAETGEPAAVKVLNPHLADDEGFCQRFELEIETLKKLKHPNIVRMFGYGQQDGFLFYAMELVKGHSVEEELQQGRRFTWREVVQDAVKLCKALRHAHDHGVIHRDIKPANLLLTEDDADIKLTDFGIARLFGNNRLTMAGALVGTAEYMSPEQATGERVTPQSDLYSLGGVMFAMLAGRPPFRAISLGEMLHKQRFDPPPPLSRFANDIPQELEELVARLLSKEPAARAPNALVLGRQLAAMEHGLSMVRERADDDEQIEDDDVVSNLPDKDKTVVKGDDLNPRAPTRAATPSLVEKPYNLDDSTMVAPEDASPAILSQSSISAKTKASLGGADAGMPVAAERCPADPVPVVSRSVSAVQNRFTTVEEDQEHLAKLERESVRSSSKVQIVLLTLSLAMIVGLLWYFTRPPSAGKLLARIEAAASEGDIGSLLSVEDDVRNFLARFPENEHAAAVKGYQNEIDLERLEQRFQIRVRLKSRDDSLNPVEHDYLEAINEVGINPQRTIAKLQALVELYGSQTNSDEYTVQCVELARRELQLLREQAAKFVPEYRSLIEENLQRAEQFRKNSPQEARAIWQSIVTLYGDKAWAAEAVAKAKAAIAETSPPRGSSSGE